MVADNEALIKHSEGTLFSRENVFINFIKADLHIKVFVEDHSLNVRDLREVNLVGVYQIGSTRGLHIS